MKNDAAHWVYFQKKKSFLPKFFSSEIMKILIRGGGGGYPFNSNKKKSYLPKYFFSKIMKFLIPPPVPMPMSLIKHKTVLIL